MMGNIVVCLLTKTSIQSKKNLTNAEGDCGVSRDDNGFVTTFRVSAIINLKLQQSREVSDKCS